MMAQRATTSLTLNPKLDLEMLATQFRAAKRLQIKDFLSKESAEALRDELMARSDWRRIISGDSKTFEIDAVDYQAMPLAERRPIEAAIEAEAAYSFRFRYEIVRVPDGQMARVAITGHLAEFALLLASRVVLDTIQVITGVQPLAFADAQATMYRPGDFLTRHDDAVDGKQRRLAYVLGLTPGWQPEWGGLLLFNDNRGGVAEAIVPRFNALSLFAVPQTHSVGCVAPFAPVPRLSVTGWIRGEVPDK